MNQSALPPLPDPYQTPNHWESSGRPPRWPSLYFYPRMLGEVWRASRLARKGQYDAESWTVSSRRMMEYLEGAGCRFEASGHEQIRQGKQDPVVLVANHMSTAETFILNNFLWPFAPITFVVKKSLVEMPVFKHILIDRKAIVMTRKNPKEDYRVLLKEGVNHLNNGTSVIIFPQSTRGAHWRRDEFNTVGVKLAKAAGADVVPVAVASDGWKNGKIVKDIGTIDPKIPFRFRYGQRIPISGNGREAHQLCLDFIESTLQEWGYGR